MPTLPTTIPPTFATLAAGGQAHTEQVYTSLANANAAADALKQHIAECINTCMSQCSGTLDDCLSCMDGCVHAKLDKVDAKLSTYQGKLESNIISQMSTAYVKAMPFGYVVPGMDEAQAVQPAAQQIAPAESAGKADYVMGTNALGQQVIVTNQGNVYDLGGTLLTGTAAIVQGQVTNQYPPTQPVVPIYDKPPPTQPPPTSPPTSPPPTSPPPQSCVLSPQQQQAWQVKTSGGPDPTNASTWFLGTPPSVCDITGQTTPKVQSYIPGQQTCWIQVCDPVAQVGFVPGDPNWTACFQGTPNLYFVCHKEAQGPPTDQPPPEQPPPTPPCDKCCCCPCQCQQQPTSPTDQPPEQPPKPKPPHEQQPPPAPPQIQQGAGPEGGGIIPGLADTFCGRIGNLTDYFASMGAALLQGSSLSCNAVVNLANTFPINNPITQGSPVPTWCQGFVDMAYKKWIDTYYPVYAQILGGGCDYNKVQALEALKGFLESINETTFGAVQGFSSAQSGGGGVGLSLGFLPGFGGNQVGINVAGGFNQMNAVTAHYRMSFVPALNLIDLCIKWACPVGFPGIGDAITMYLANQIDDNELACLVRANGGQITEYSNVIYAKRTRQSVQDIVRLYYRNALTEDQLKDAMRGNGVTDFVERQRFVDLYQKYPGVQDILLMMQRDVADPNIVNTFQLDAEFDVKFQGVLKDWAQYEGLPLEVVQNWWRAHWTVPGIGQLFEMLHRLRPDKPDVANAGLQVTASDVDMALGQNDIAPYWRNRLMSLSYRILTRIDIRRLLNDGLLTSDQVLSIYKDNGYTSDDATRLTEFALVERVKAVKREPQAKAFESGVMSSSDFSGWLGSKGLSLDETNQVINDLRQQQTWDHRKKCMEALHKRYMLGDVSDTDMNSALTSIGIDPEAIGGIFAQWQCERTSRGRAVNASELCSWGQNGLISAADMYQRLLRLGYNNTDANYIISMCQIKLNQKLAAQAAKEQKQEQAALAKEQKQEAAAAKAQQAAADKAAKQQAKAEEYNESQRRTMAKASAKLARSEGAGIDYATTQVTLAIQALTQIGTLEPQDAIDRIYDLVYTVSDFSVKPFEAFVAEMVTSEKVLSTYDFTE